MDHLQSDMDTTPANAPGCWGDEHGASLVAGGASLRGVWKRMHAVFISGQVAAPHQIRRTLQADNPINFVIGGFRTVVLLADGMGLD